MRLLMLLIGLHQVDQFAHKSLRGIVGDTSVTCPQYNPNETIKICKDLGCSPM